MLDPRENISHNSTLTLVLLAEFGAGDALARLEACFRAARFEILEAFAGFGEILSWKSRQISTVCP